MTITGFRFFRSRNIALYTLMISAAMAMTAAPAADQEVTGASRTTSAHKDTRDDSWRHAPATLRAAYIEARQAEARTDPRYAVQPDPSGLRLRGHDLDGAIDEVGIALDGAGIAGRLETRAIRCGARELWGNGGPPAVDRSAPNRVVRGGGAEVVEWYLNGPLGIEHGFDLERAACRDVLTIELATPGLIPVAAGSDVRLVAGDGSGAVAYAGLFARDQHGLLESWFEITSDRVRILVDTRTATGSIVIDPLIYTEERLAVGSAASDYFGAAVALSGDTALVGAPLNDVGANLNQGSVYVFVRSGETWTQEAKLTAPDGAANDEFGASVALDLDTAVVGARLDDIGNNSNQGAAYVFVRSGETWTQEAKLTAGDGSKGDEFGAAVALSGDTALVGAGKKKVGHAAEQGAAYVFVRSGTSWSQQQKLLAADGSAKDRFGSSVALSGDTALVGAPLDDEGAMTDRGSAYVFFRATGWSQAKLTAPDGGAAGDNFGHSLALDFPTAVVGAIGDDVDGNADQGSAYVFFWIGTGWIFEQKLVASDGATGDWFGSSVGVYGDMVLIGAYGDDVGSSTNQGSAYLFTRSAEWSEALTIPGNFAFGPGNAYAGWSVALTDELTAVGAPLAVSNGVVFFGHLTLTAF